MIPLDKEIEAEVLSVIEKREFPEGRPHGLVDFTPHQEIVSFGVECAQWMRSELLKRSEQGFEEYAKTGISVPPEHQCYVSFQEHKHTWQAAQLSQAATVKRLHEELAKKDVEIKELRKGYDECLIKGGQLVEAGENLYSVADKKITEKDEYITKLEDAFLKSASAAMVFDFGEDTEVMLKNHADLINSIKQKREKI